MSIPADAARESARHDDGRFGTQTRTEAGVALESLDQHPDVLGAVAKAKETGRPVLIAADVLPGNCYDPGDNGSSCGDTSLGKEPSDRRTWATGKADEPYITVTETCFVVAREDGADHDMDYGDWEEHAARMARAAEADEQADGIYSGIEHLVDNDREIANADIDRLRRLAAGIRDEEGVVRYSVETQTAWSAHTVVDDPGSSEVRADYSYDAATDLSSTSMTAATATAEQTVKAINWERDYSPENWK